MQRPVLHDNPRVNFSAKNVPIAVCSPSAKIDSTAIMSRSGSSVYKGLSVDFASQPMNVLRANMQSISLLTWEKNRATSYLSTLGSARYRSKTVLSNFVNGRNRVEGRYMPSVPGWLQSSMDPWMKS